jgi:hypothetical protein
LLCQALPSFGKPWKALASFGKGTNRGPGKNGVTFKIQVSRSLDARGREKLDFPFTGARKKLFAAGFLTASVTSEK